MPRLMKSARRPRLGLSFHALTLRGGRHVHGLPVHLRLECHLMSSLSWCMTQFWLWCACSDDVRTCPSPVPKHLGSRNVGDSDPGLTVFVPKDKLGMGQGSSQKARSNHPDLSGQVCWLYAASLYASLRDYRFKCFVSFSCCLKKTMHPDYCDFFLLLDMFKSDVYAKDSYATCGFLVHVGILYVPCLHRTHVMYVVDASASPCCRCKH